ncbi:putative steroid-binding protein 3 [Vanrija pseudolonga]|uniref:Steroid-binding protein 3 n=1 Tax=Vanrija pseudolonga TaxID=143232 RepID=A0AAF1BMG6_9TREE|nr:putative steroid-binding protein 3 [Vanrija pseudolonga]
MGILDTLTSTPALVAGALGLSAYLYTKTRAAPPVSAANAAAAAAAPPQKPKSSEPEPAGAKVAASASIMSSPAADLAPPKDDPISVAELAKFDGSDPSKPIYVAIKGRVYDVSAKTEMYGKGSGYNVFAGKDASRGLGMSSLDAKDAVADYSTLTEAQRKTLDQWDSFFAKRYNVVGKVVP